MSSTTVNPESFEIDFRWYLLDFKLNEIALPKTQCGFGNTSLEIERTINDVQKALRVLDL